MTARHQITASVPYLGINAQSAGTRIYAKLVTALDGNTQTSERYTTIMEAELGICLAVIAAMGEAKEVADVLFANENSHGL